MRAVRDVGAISEDGPAVARGVLAARRPVGPHKDGWGIAWYDERDVRVVKETSPAAGSPCVRFIQDNPFVSPFVISHVRRATRGGIALRNCQPFVRELGGAWHSFAHNGDLAGIDYAAR